MRQRKAASAFVSLDRPSGGQGAREAIRQRLRERHARERAQ